MDLISDVDYGPQLSALTWLLISISGLFLLTRLYLKNCQHRGFWWDDWILLGSWVTLTASACLIAFLVNLGYGKRFIPLPNATHFGLPVNALSTLMIISNLWGKTSFGVTLLRIPVRWMRMGVWFILLTLTLTLTTSVLFVWIECGPFKLVKNCVPINVSIRYNVFSCVYSAISDIALAVLPWSYLLGQQMSKKEKVGAMIAMSMGLFAGATAAAKASTIPKLEGATDARGSIPLVALGTAESAVCIVAASIPILRALSRGGFGRAVHFGYETSNQTITMAESGPRNGADPLNRTSFRAVPIAPQPGRWAATSATGNIDTEYRLAWKDPEKAYTFVCWCRPPFEEDPGEDEDEDEDDDDEDDEDDPSKRGTCLCGKPVDEHPDHKWMATNACRRKFFGLTQMALFRDPANFDLHAYNHYTAYGMVEMVENLLLDFSLAELMRLVGRVFLAMLSRLERIGRLKPDSEVKNLSLIMSLYIRLAYTLRENDIFTGRRTDKVELKAADGSAESYTFDLNKFDGYICGYADRHNITIPDTSIDAGLADSLPIQTPDDPWNTPAALLHYVENYGKMEGPEDTPSIGGDKYDITTWKIVERKKASYTGRDPFSRKELERLKQGMILNLG
ncbi:hypothetical protein C7999DRAFT_14520 [Corynascus novoguineensis]|uniref:Rhodopsin domain-containing protein n=1 Tax=Corynascus novoguineensis TaxID=1126955 RepID=A0AAN7HJ00_9PEZI|nr:hypothetical protein C7999DRAFT_14520 [Corynascus novoguineensis]